jgi:adenylate kinase family enzyme
MRRILVGGISGAGKSTLAAALAARLDVPHYELDRFYHGPSWTPRPSFVADVLGFADLPAWICEDQYHDMLGEVLWRRADTLVWLDLPLRTVMSRVVRRSLARVLTRRELWNGNRETWRALLFDPGHPVRWAWTQHGRRRRDTAARIARHPHLTVVRLATAGQVRRWFGNELCPDADRGCP